MPIVDDAALAERGLGLTGINGLHQVRVTLDPATPGIATLEVMFWNDTLVSALAADPAAPTDKFRIIGGNRLPGGTSAGRVQVTTIATTAAANMLRLSVAPIGDYSTYTLAIVDELPLLANKIDPLFDSIDFKFRPGCFSIDCAPAWTRPAPPSPTPAMDTLARDYDRSATR